MDENKLLDLIRQSADEVDVPDSLSPENIKRMLGDPSTQSLVQDEQKDTAKMDENKNKKRFYRKWAAAAAVVAVAAISGAAAMSSHISNQKSAVTNDEIAADTDMTEAASEADSTEGTDDIQAARADDIIGVDSYDTVYDTLEDYLGVDDEIYYNKDIAVEESVAEVTTDSVALEAAETENSGFSTTNIQEAGVDEADIIKTDGKYLYILRDNVIRIVSAKGAASEYAGAIELDDYTQQVHEFYLDQDTLSVISTYSEASLVTEDDYYYEPSFDNYTMVQTYDISDPAAPKLAGTVKQNGTYCSSRKVDNMVYLFTQFYPDIRDKKEVRRYIPNVNDTLIDPKNICIPEHLNDSDYLVISSVDIRNPDQTVDEKAILSAGSEYYVSPENIYVYQQDWSHYETRTAFLKFHYADGKITFGSMAALNGYVNDRFSLNEYNGYLRIVMTTDSSENALYVLDEKMKPVGTIQNIAPGETIRSARFMGDTGYFVTYRNMDPLFSVDLSDPSHPRLLGALKVTGFSSYLHFYGKDLLLGVGEETDPRTGDFLGYKISMYDTSDPAQVTELSNYVFEGTYMCPAADDPRALLVDAEKNLIGIAVDYSYYIFRYDVEKGFVKLLEYKSNDGYQNGDTPSDLNMEPYYNRSCYADNILYLAMDNRLQVFDMQQDYSHIATVDLK